MGLGEGGETKSIGLAAFMHVRVRAGDSIPMRGSAGIVFPPPPHRSYCG